MPLRLGVNIDHIATLRQVRYAGALDSPNCEPDILAAAGICEKAGAHGITVHLREDRRHIQEQDVERLRESILTRLNLEMGNTPDVLKVALRVVPEEACLVPEHRRELTTEGGLDAAGRFRQIEPTVRRLQAAGVRVSLFIEPDPVQIAAAARLKADAVELHTGAFANTHEPQARRAELERLIAGAVNAFESGLEVHAGHGINYRNIIEILEIPHLTELNIGHAIVARALVTGLEQAVRDMLRAMATYTGAPGAP